MAQHKHLWYASFRHEPYGTQNIFIVQAKDMDEAVTLLRPHIPLSECDYLDAFLGGRPTITLWPLEFPNGPVRFIETIDTTKIGA